MTQQHLDFGSHEATDAAYDAVAAVLGAAHSILITAHQQPDGDAVGSALALWHILTGLGKQTVVFNVDPICHNMTFLPGASEWRTELDPDECFDVTVVVDCAERHRVGAQFPKNGFGETVVVIDHHKTWDPAFPDVNIRDEGAAAVGEIIVRLAGALAAPLTAEVAQCCYASIVTDTGSFRYSNTSPTTFGIAAHLIAAGVDPWHMTSHIYEDNPVERLQLLAMVLQTLEVSACGRLAFLRVDRSMLSAVSDGEGLLDGFINYARSIRGVEVATQLRERDEGRYQVSFRSRGSVDVALLAEAFGGGGHHNAAGCVIEGRAVDIQRRLTERLDLLLDGD